MVMSSRHAKYEPYHIMHVLNYSRPLVTGKTTERLEAIFGEVYGNDGPDLPGLGAMPDQVKWIRSYYDATLASVSKDAGERYLSEPEGNRA